MGRVKGGADLDAVVPKMMGVSALVLVVGVSMTSGLRTGAFLAAAFSLLYSLWASVSAAIQRMKGTRKQGSSGGFCDALAQLCPWFFGGSDEAFERKLAELRVKYAADVARGEGEGDEATKIGMQLVRAREHGGALEVSEIVPGCLVDQRNKTVAEAGRVLVGDRLERVNDKTSNLEMMMALSDANTRDFDMEFSRLAENNKHYRLWEVDLEKLKPDEFWGINICEFEHLDAFKVTRVFGGSVVSRWNRWASQRGKRQLIIYPGDVIFACGSKLRASQILDAMSKSKRVSLTMLRWLDQDVSKVEEPVVDDVEPEPAPCPTIDHKTLLCEKPKVPQGPPCSCCGQHCEKYLVMKCHTGEDVLLRRECWRKKYGGFTQKHVPEKSPGGDRVTRIEVYERSTNSDDARLIHTIQAPEAPAAEPAPTESTSGTARKRAASGKRSVQRVVPEAPNADEEAPAGRRGDVPRALPRVALDVPPAADQANAPKQQGSSSASKPKGTSGDSVQVSSVTDASGSESKALPNTASSKDTKAASALSASSKSKVTSVENVQVPSVTNASGSGSKALPGAASSKDTKTESAPSASTRSKITLADFVQVPSVTTSSKDTKAANAPKEGVTSRNEPRIEAVGAVSKASVAAHDVELSKTRSGKASVSLDESSNVASAAKVNDCAHSSKVSSKENASPASVQDIVSNARALKTEASAQQAQNDSCKVSPKVSNESVRSTRPEQCNKGGSKDSKGQSTFEKDPKRSQSATPNKIGDYRGACAPQPPPPAATPAAASAQLEISLERLLKTLETAPAPSAAVGPPPGLVAPPPGLSLPPPPGLANPAAAAGRNAPLPPGLVLLPPGRVDRAAPPAASAAAAESPQVTRPLLPEAPAQMPPPPPTLVPPAQMPPPPPTLVPIPGLAAKFTSHELEREESPAQLAPEPAEQTAATENSKAAAAGGRKNRWKRGSAA
eukprot:TRINITY_DN2257_c0_g2_i1.p1 TRINITY_DN2257_c0_g2~~TRINITY_DN2257_c0_g2_i1.p1  ORF type:complete len:956 (+),score=197.39 TRINITY_DN2257_c0_g2_i1:113-2980(+)